MGNSSSLLELFEMLEELLGIRLRYDKLPWRHEDQKFFVADVATVNAALAWGPKTGKKEGVEKVLAWKGVGTP
jgi:CDP-paratose 2-epimerase